MCPCICACTCTCIYMHTCMGGHVHILHIYMHMSMHTNINVSQWSCRHRLSRPRDCHCCLNHRCLHYHSHRLRRLHLQSHPHLCQHHRLSLSNAAFVNAAATPHAVWSSAIAITACPPAVAFLYCQLLRPPREGQGQTVEL